MIVNHHDELDDLSVEDLSDMVKQARQTYREVYKPHELRQALDLLDTLKVYLYHAQYPHKKYWL